MLFSIDIWKNKVSASGASITTNMHIDAAMDMECLFGAYGGVIGNVVGDCICMYLIDVEGVVFVS